MICAATIFDQDETTYLNYDYHLFGEDMDAAHPHWAHEGVDLDYTGASGHAVYAPISGTVYYKDDSTIMIHPDSGSYSVNVQHLDGAIAGGTHVTKGVTRIGYEGIGDGENHIHIGVCTDNGNHCTTIHPGSDTAVVLDCVPPYNYID